MMKNISYFNVSEKPQGHLGNIKIASSASLNMNFNPYIYIIDFQSNFINYLTPIPSSYPYKMKYFIRNGGVRTARE